MSVHYNGANKFPTPCVGCRKMVPPGIGVDLHRDKESGRWMCYCAPCYQKAKSPRKLSPMEMPRLTVTFSLEPDTRISAMVSADAPSPVRTTYFEVTRAHGFFWSKDERKNFGGLGGLAQVVKALEGEGFHIEFDKALTDYVQDSHEGAKEDTEAARKRAEFIDKLLLKDNKKLYPYQRTTIDWLSPRTTALIGHDPGLGKAQPVDSPVLTPSGWRLMGELKVGDDVVGSDGKAKKIIGVFPQGERDIFRVCFSDGASVECDGDHLWEVWTAKRTNAGYQGSQRKVMSAAQLADFGVKDACGKRIFKVKTVAPIDCYDPKPLPLDPYILGALLGDGSLGKNSVHMTSADQEVVDSFNSALPDGVEARPVASSGGIGYGITTGSRAGGAGRNPVLNYLREAGLAGMDSFTKFIPKAYMFASLEHRKQLLRGLIDTDGYIQPGTGTVIYYTVSDQLALDMVSLVRSLGGVARRTLKKPTYEYKGNKLLGADCHIVTISLPNSVTPCRLKRKRALLVPKSKYPAAHYIDRIEPAGRKQAQCILIDSPDHLYVTQDYVLTHNTLMALASLPAAAPVVIICPKNAKGVWIREICSWRPDYGSCRRRKRGDLTFLEPERGITDLEGKNAFEWPKVGEVVILTYAILPLTPAEHAEAVELVNEWESRGQPENYTVTVKNEEGEDEEIERTAEDIAKAQRLVTMKPVTPPPEGTILIADEAHNVKTRKAKKQSNRARRFKAVAEYVRSNGGRTWTLTGTPLLNEPAELWAILTATGNANEIFGSRKRFDSLFRKEGKSWKALPSVPKLLQQGMLRFSERDVLKSLPPRTRVEVKVDISPEDRERLDELLIRVEQAGQARLENLLEKEREKAEKAAAKRAAAEEAKKKKRKGRDEDEDEEEDDTDSIMEAQGLAQETALSGDIDFEELSAVRTAVAKAKIPALLRMVEDYVQRGEKIIVFSDHLEPIKTIYEKYGREGGGWALIDGSVSARKRTAIEDEFQRDGSSLVGIAATIGAAGVALTLTKATTAIFIEENWVPAINLQAQKRIHRIGQFKPVTIKVLVADHPIDEMIAAANERKIRLVEEAIEKASADPESEVTSIAEDLDDVKRIVREAAGKKSDFEEIRIADEFERAQGRRPTTESPSGDVISATPVRGPGGAPGGRSETPSGYGEAPAPPAPRQKTGGYVDMIPPLRRKDWIAPTTPDELATAETLIDLLKNGGFKQGDTVSPSFASTLLSQGGMSQAQWKWAFTKAKEYGAVVQVATSMGPKRPRQASGALEEWAARGLVALAGMDTDRAREQNQMGFSKFDGEIGHDFASRIEAGTGLTDGQWAVAIRLATRYRRQVGAPPETTSRNPSTPADSWHVIVSEVKGGTPTEEGVIGNDDVKIKIVRVRGADVPAKLIFPKEKYTEHEAAAWATAHGIAWIRVEG